MNRDLPDLTLVLQRRFEAKVAKGQPDECWMWTGAKQSRGYGSMGMGPRGACRTFLAHRLAYHWFVGPIDAGLQIDHICHNVDGRCKGGPGCLHRRCVNPAHLEPVTQAENLWRTGWDGRLALREQFPSLIKRAAS